jgi:putative oxidoreductase
MNADRGLLLLRLASGGVFVAFGLGKFVNHASELASFRTYGLPAPAVLVPVIGVVEVVGGMLLIAGIYPTLAALVLAGDMVAAIITSGIAKGEVVSLTLAPAELAAMVLVLWVGPGHYRVRHRDETRASTAAPAARMTSK